MDNTKEVIEEILIKLSEIKGVTEKENDSLKTYIKKHEEKLNKLEYLCETRYKDLFKKVINTYVIHFIDPTYKPIQSKTFVDAISKNDAVHEITMLHPNYEIIKVELFKEHKKNNKKIIKFQKRLTIYSLCLSIIAFVLSMYNLIFKP